jgi:hypothetical protein
VGWKAWVGNGWVLGYVGSKTKVQNENQNHAKPKNQNGAVSLVPPNLGFDLEIAISRNLAQSRAISQRRLKSEALE